MFSSTDLIAAASALLVHVVVALGLLYLPPPRAHSSEIVEVDVRRRTPPPQPVVTPPEPPKPVEPPPPPPRKVIARLKPNAPPPPPTTPPPNREPPKEPPKDPPKPVFGMTNESTTTGESSMTAPVGNTTMIDPAKSAKHTGGPIAPLPPSGPPPVKPSYQPVSDLYIKTMPEIDSEACGRGLEYPEEALQLGIEGTVKLRIELDERGHVHDVKVLSGLGHGLDQAAVNAMKHRSECRFRPAVATDGKAVPFVVSPYTFMFELPR